MSTHIDAAQHSRGGPGKSASRARKRIRLVLAAVLLGAVSAGCTGVGRWVHQGFKVGPDYLRPPAPVADNWIDYENPAVASVPADYSSWWNIFGDPKLNQLIDAASQQNLTLQAAGMRILEARARLAIARGSLFPQVQQAYGDYARINGSTTTANVFPVNDFDIWDAGFNASWELDFWGRFRRAIEAEDALLNAEIENYDNVLVILQAEVAAAYIQFRTLQQRLELAEKNVELQQRTVEIADVLFRNGRRDEFDVVLAKQNLALTKSLIPQFESDLRQTGNAICVLLGVPPYDLTVELGPGPIPEPPPEVQILAGIPAELLRRRPDVRRAERLAAAQSAAIGIAESDLYPRIAITGFIGFESKNLSKLFDERSFTGSVGPGFQWNIFNYGRIVNSVRANEAKFSQLVLDYQNTVLTANQEVEDGIISFLKERERLAALGESTTQADRALSISRTLYDQGKLETLLPVVFLEQELTDRQDALATSRGAVSVNLVSIYKALGGGWQTRIGGGGRAPEAGANIDQAPPENVPPLLPMDPAVPAEPVLPVEPPAR